jgi:hypothetical protein
MSLVVEGDTTKRRTTVAEAAAILGISAEAVRGRIRRGTLPVERESGTVYVLLDTSADERTTGDRTRTTADQPTDRTDLLIAELQDRVRSLEEANRENRRIIAALTQRIPELEAPASSLGSEPRESPTEPASEADRVEASQNAGGEAQEGTEKTRPWWRRVFGG